MTENRLSNRTAKTLNVKGSSDDFSDCDVGILHFGPGAFHRAHQAVYTHNALKKGRGNWRIVGVSLKSIETADILNEQDCLYSLLVRQDGRAEVELVQSIAGIEAVSRNPEAVYQKLASPGIRIVSMTVTEKAYGINRDTSEIDPGHEAVAHDLKNSETPTGILGMLVYGLRTRFLSDVPPFTVVCCDNLPQNGDLLRSGVISFAKALGEPDLAAWISENVAFPNSMVDRITPAMDPGLPDEVSAILGVRDELPIEAEPFSQWVIEDRFPSGRPAWEAAGVLFVDRVAPYEKMKLRMLNGAHSFIAYAGFLTSHRFVRDAMNDTAISGLVERHIHAASKTLEPVPGIDLPQYGRELVKRFSNPNIAHETYQIAMDGSQKMPQRIFEPAMVCLELGSDIAPFAFTTALWMRYCSGLSEEEIVYDLRDPRSAELKEAFHSGLGHEDEIVRCFNEITDLIPERLSSNQTWNSKVKSYLGIILDRGVYSALSM